MKIPEETESQCELIMADNKIAGDTPTFVGVLTRVWGSILTEKFIQKLY